MTESHRVRRSPAAPQITPAASTARRNAHRSSGWRIPCGKSVGLVLFLLALFSARRLLRPTTIFAGAVRPLHGPGPVRPERGPDLGLHRHAQPRARASFSAWAPTRSAYSLEIQQAARPWKPPTVPPRVHGRTCQFSLRSVPLARWLGIPHQHLVRHGRAVLSRPWSRHAVRPGHLSAAHQGRLLLADHPGLLLAVFTLVDNQQPYTGGRVGIQALPTWSCSATTFNSITADCSTCCTTVAVRRALLGCFAPGEQSCSARC